nr:histidine phosphatase family protein [uncultured Sphingomonas sp.]
MNTDRAKLPVVTMVRHGETEWSRTGRHTGRTDIPLTAEGRDAALLLRDRLPAGPYAEVRCSPSSRAQDTCRLAGFGDVMIIDEDLAEWDYGEFEGRTTMEIQMGRPGWDIFRDGCPGGERAADVGARVDRVIRIIRVLDAPCLLFSSAHTMRVMGARWIGLPPEGGALFTLDTATISALGYDHDLTEPAIKRWNDMNG